MLQTLQREIVGVMAEANAIGLFSSLCTIMQPDGELGPSGAPSGTYVAVSGLIDIPCQDAPKSQINVQATETKTLQEIERLGFRHVLLNGYYPQSTPDGQIPQGWVADVDGTNYEILGVEHDSQNQMTRLSLQLVQL